MITLSIPSNWKEVKEYFKNKFKRMSTPKRVTHNNMLLWQLEKSICKELNSGYWDRDISGTMRKSFTSGFPNGKIYILINEVVKNLK